MIQAPDGAEEMGFCTVVFCLPCRGLGNMRAVRPIAEAMGIASQNVQAPDGAKDDWRRKPAIFFRSWWSLGNTAAHFPIAGAMGYYRALLRS